MSVWAWELALAYVSASAYRSVWAPEEVAGAAEVVVEDQFGQD